MKKTVFIAVIISLQAAMCCAQTKPVDVNWGPELEGSKRGTITQMIGYDDNGYYIRSVEKNDHYLVRLDKKMNAVATVKIEEKDEQSKLRLYFEDMYFFNDELLLFQSYVNKKTKKNVLTVRKIDKKTMLPKTPLTNLTEIEILSRKNAGNFTIYSTKDESKLMIGYNLPYEKKQNERFGAIICDKDMNVLWTKEFELPYTDKFFSVVDFSCDNDGNLYVMGKLYNGKVKEVVSGKQNFRYHLVCYTDKGNSKTEYEIKLNDKFITDITYAIGNNGDIVTSGFYSKEGTSSIDGCFYMTLDRTTKNVKTTSLKEFDLDFITQGLSEKAEKKIRKKEEKGKDTELYQYDLHDLVMRDDGGVVLIGEQFYIEVVTTYNGKTTTTTYYYHYDNLIVVNINSSGNIEWAQKINKRQVSRNDGGPFSSFAMAVVKDKLYFIFNDNKENLTNKEGKTSNFSLSDRKGIVTVVTMNQDGTSTRSPLYTNEEIEVLTRPKVCRQINDSEMLLFGERKKTDQFALLKFIN